MQDSAFLARRNIWSHAIVENQTISSIAGCQLMDAVRFAENYSTVVSINVKKNVIREAVENVIKLLNFKKHVLAENMISKCLQETLSSEKAVKIQFQFVECPAAKNYNAAIPALEVATKDHAKTVE